ncbi:MAG: AmmeMemoRadiSam system protein B [Lysobacterales bacterium]|jgi:AmmeMemoRadiSam system protein B|nr:MAG: AmmeMemoRadiSam system protein B [Xanthomonadales bacterium]
MLSLAGSVSRVRPPAVAGLFYPGDPAALRRLVESCISDARPSAGARIPRALIVPHAGYAYSGAVAGQAYRALRDSGARPARVVVAGPSHRVPMRGLAVSSLDAFETPLGKVPIDDAARQRLRELGLVGLSDAPHAVEHSIEVQLPFLQAVLGDRFVLLPVAIGLAPPEQVARALDAAWSDPDTLLVVSSDLSHHHTYDEARKLDAESGRSILDRRDDLSDEQACGARGINGLMQLARRRGLVVELLDLRNSGDTAGDRSRVVGYGSYALYDA